MPIYEFICSECKEQFEKILPSTDISSVTCTKCGSTHIKKMISSGSFRLNTGGSAGRQSTPPPPCGGSGFS